MKRFGGKWLTLACLGILFSFLSLLFVASVGGRSDGREIPFDRGVLANPSCFVSGCHMSTGSTLNQAGSVLFNNLPASFVPGETYDLGITMAGGSTYGFQVAVVFSDDTQAGALMAVTEGTIVDDVQGVQILTQTSPLVTNSVDFQWLAPWEPKEGNVIFKVASNSANSNFSPTGDAINELEVSISQVELAEKLFFAQFANGGGWFSQISLLTLASGEAVNAKLELLDDDGVPLDVVLNGERVVGETEIFRISEGGAAVFVSDGEGPLVSGSVAVSSDGPLSGVVLFDGGAINLGVAGVGSSEPLASFRAPMESRSGDPVIKTGVAVMNLDAGEKTLQVRLLDLEGTIVGTGTVAVDPLAANGHIARFLDEFNWDEPAPDLTAFQGVLEVVPSTRTGGGHCAAFELRKSMASLPVAPIQ